MQFAQDSRYQRSLKKVWREGIMPSFFFICFQIDDLSDVVKFEKTSPLCTRPFTVILSFEEIPGARSCRVSTVLTSTLSILARSCFTSEDQYCRSSVSPWTISCEQDQHRSSQGWHLYYLVAAYSQNLRKRTDLHAMYYQRGRCKQGIKSSSNTGMRFKSAKPSGFVIRQPGQPPILKVRICLISVLPNLSVDLAVARGSFIGVFFSDVGSKVGTNI